MPPVLKFTINNPMHFFMHFSKEVVPTQQSFFLQEWDYKVASAHVHLFKFFSIFQSFDFLFLNEGQDEVI